MIDISFTVICARQASQNRSLMVWHILDVDRNLRPLAALSMGPKKQSFHISLLIDVGVSVTRALSGSPQLLLIVLVNYYLSLGGSLLDLDVCFWSGPTACCEGSAPLLLSTCAPGEAVSWEEAAAVLKGVWDLDRSWSRAFFSLGTSDPAPVAVSLRVPSWLGCWGPLPKNHAPDLVKISCCFRHKLHTHITYLKERKSNIKKKDFPHYLQMLY